MIRKILVMMIVLVAMLALFEPKMNAVNSAPTWYVDARCFTKSGTAGAFDQVSVKDPSIVYTEGKYHLFFTGVTSAGWWQMGYASATTIAGLSSAQHNFFSKISEGYFCAPQVFYFEPQSKWYMIYNDGTYGAAYATTTNIADPNSWNGPKSLGVPNPTGYDFWIICDDTYAYLFNTQDGSSRNILWRRTPLANFPTGWSSPQVAVTDTFEGVCVYKSLADGKYYMLPEDYNDNRYYELWTANALSGPWTKIAEQWASYHNLVYTADHWTDNVSHGEIIRAGVNQKLEINDIDRVDFMIQGVVNGNYPDYAQIPWSLGVIHNYNLQNPTPTPTIPKTATPTPVPTPTPGPQSAFLQIEAESYNTQSGIQTESCGEGGQNIGYIENGDYVVYNNIDFGGGAASFQARVASGTSGGSIEIRLDSTSGTLVGKCSVAETGDWQTWVTSTCSVSGASGTHNLYLKFTGGSGYLFNMNWFQFIRESVTPTPSATTTSTPTPVVTSTPTVTPTPVRTATPRRTATPARTATPRRTATPGRTATPRITPTPVTATPTPVVTTTPSSTATPLPTGSIKVQFYNQSTAATSNQIYLNIQLMNTGTGAIALSDVKIRYYYTADGNQPQTFYCDYSPVGSSNVTGSFVTMAAAKTGADTYVEVGFSGSAGSLAAGGNTTIQARFAKNDWTSYTQSNDYSFNSSAPSYVDWTKVTGYVSGALQWGIEP